MGLDNGIIVKNKTRKELPPWIRYFSEKDYVEGVEICYWRKWWGFRNEIMNKFATQDDQCYIDLKREDIRAIFYILEWYLKYPEEATHGYWEDDEVKKKIKVDLWNLFWLYIHMLFHPDTEVYFYDSY